MPALVKHLGLADYLSTYEAMQTFTKSRNNTTQDEIWVLEHPPVFTLGLAGDAANLHSPSKQIPLVEVDRGGEITYHGPGQIVIYLLLDLKRLGISKNCSYHGLALNVATDLEAFGRIHPCGYEGLKTVDMQTLGIKDNIDTISQRLLEHLQKQLMSHDHK